MLSGVALFSILSLSSLVEVMHETQRFFFVAKASPVFVIASCRCRRTKRREYNRLSVFTLDTELSTLHASVEVSTSRGFSSRESRCSAGSSFVKMQLPGKKSVSIMLGTVR